MNEGDTKPNQDKVTLPLKLDADTWASVLEQLMLFMFVIARWVLPRGKLTRDQLSQLLFVYIGSASDVMELFVIFEEPEIRSDVTFSYVTLGVWSLSLLQFCLILTATRNIGSRAIAKHTAVDGDIPEDEVGQEKVGYSACCDKVFQLEIWTLFICLILQDGPFLGVRLYAIFVKGVLSYGIIFFTAKNILILFLLCYRVIVLCYSKFTKDLDNQNRNNGFSRKNIVGPYSAEKK
ncbi:transmembrane protein 26-like [Mytilus californianus]|uniref:transmembrane protein 26-like n=1 Tax=Mytilus californianus TaxID=6549 RepID=UPI002245C2A0|nr:transmembrane protein 26-like [Mytilus californianus]